MNAPKYAWFIFFALILAMLAIGYAYANEVRPKKQISYDTAKPYCSSNGGQLHGQGEIVLNEYASSSTFKIDCP